MKRYLVWGIPCLSVLLGALGSLSYAPFELALFSIISFMGLIALIANASPRRAFFTAFCWGMGYFIAGVHWIYISVQEMGGVPPPLALLIVLLLMIYLSFYPALFAYLLRRCQCIAPAFSLMQMLVLMPLLWSVTEWIRASLFNGFAWLQWGYTQLETPLRGYVPILGIDGVTLLFVMISGALLVLAAHFIQYFSSNHTNKTAKKCHLRISLLSTSIVCLLIIGEWLSHHEWTSPIEDRAPVISLLQGNVAQSIKWQPGQLEATQANYLELIQETAAISDLIILPEAALPSLEIYQDHYLRLLSQIAEENDVAIAVGLLDRSVRDDGTTAIYNSVIALNPTEPYHYPHTDRYNKHHLVPFGEYTPLSALFMPLANQLNIPMSSMSEGDAQQPRLQLKGYPVTLVICYEIILSQRVLENFDPSVEFLITVSNDAWFGDSIGPWQHLQMAKARALEFGRPLLRSTNTGITAIITSRGEVQAMLPQFERGALTETVHGYQGTTPYVKGGYLVHTLLLWLLTAIAALSFFKAYRTRSHLQ